MQVGGLLDANTRGVGCFSTGLYNDAAPPHCLLAVQVHDEASAAAVERLRQVEAAMAEQQACHERAMRDLRYEKRVGDYAAVREVHGPGVILEAVSASRS